MKRIVITLLAALIGLSVFGQGDVNSPFSIFGIGNLADRGYMHLRQMGGISSAYYDVYPYRLNFENPASLAHLRTTVFDIGLEAQNSKLSDKNNSASIWSGNLGYLGLGFTMRNPVNELLENQKSDFSWGMGVNLAPVSTISYSIGETSEHESLGTIERRYAGEGGYYKVAWGNGVRYKNLSIGANLGYRFGKEKYDRIVDFVDKLNAFDNSYASSYTARGFYWDAGAMYTHYLDDERDINGNVRTERKYLVVGATTTASSNLRTEAEEININFYTPTSQDFLVDTVLYSPATKGTAVLPSEFSVGLSYFHNSKVMIGVDLRSTQWSEYKNDAKPETLRNTMRIGVGGYYCPDYNSVNSFWQRVQYRAGFYLDEDARQVQGKDIKNYGVTFGVGLPFSWQRKFSNLNVGLDIRRRVVDDILSETIYKINFGFTFNDNEWFIKRKYN